MKRSRGLVIRVQVTEDMIRSILCRKLQGARGHIYTFKPGPICFELLGFEDRGSQACRVAVRQFIMEVLREAIVGELSAKYRLVVQVNKARELLGCD